MRNTTPIPSVSRMDRRHFLRGAGVLLALPWLESLQPALARKAEPENPRRMLLISNNLGVLPKRFFPTGEGRDYELSPYLRELEAFREDFTVFSGLSHPGVTGGHSTENCFLTAAKGPARSGFRNQISLDQFAADQMGQVTRFSTLNLGVNLDRANRSLSWTRDGALLPAENSALAVFRRMFVQGTPQEVARQLHRLEERGSVLDALLEQTRSVTRSLGADDRSRMEQYLTSMREVEERLHAAREWEARPRPQAPEKEPRDLQEKRFFLEKFELMLAMARLAFESDSTRIVTLMVDGLDTGVFQLHENQNTTEAYHGLSHHGQAEAKVRQLEETDLQQMRLLRGLLGSLAETPEQGRRLLDQTMVLYGSNLGDANTHDNSNLPILLAGGGFRHGSHLVFPREANAPLSNLFVSMLQRFGVEAERFGSSTGRLRGLDPLPGA
jgi:hypothetical protein